MTGGNDTAAKKGRLGTSYEAALLLSIVRSCPYRGELRRAPALRYTHPSPYGNATAAADSGGFRRAHTRSDPKSKPDGYPGPFAHPATPAHTHRHGCGHPDSHPTPHPYTPYIHANACAYAHANP